MTVNRRMTVTAALACVLASTVLFPVFTDSVWFAAATGAVITAAGVGALTRMRALPVPVCLAAGVAGLLLYLNLVFEGRYSLLFIIPTPASLSRLWHLFGTGFHESSRYAPPVPHLASLVLLAAGGVGITAVMTDLIAVRMRSTALAGLPLLVLFTVPVMVNAPHSQLATGLVFCLGGAGYLAMLSADGRERIRVWGRLISLWRSGPRHTATRTDTAFGGMAGEEKTAREPRPGPDTRALAAAGRRVGLASIVLALCAPLLVPGLHPSKLFSSGPGIGGEGGSSDVLALPSALAQTVTQLHESRPATVFTYSTDATQSLQNADAEYFRQYVFNTLTDSGWQVTDYSAGATPVNTPLPLPQGLSDTTSTQYVNTTINVSRQFPGPGAQPAFLPVPYPATSINVPGRWLADPDLMVYSTGSSIAGQSYSVSSLAVDPTTAQLDAVPRLAKTASLERDLQLPASYETSALKNLAVEHAAGQTTEFGKVDALAAWLSGGQFSYNLAAGPFTSAAGLFAFLTKGKAGFCVQYAYAMTVLSRLLDIPARFVVGYTSGTRAKDGSYTVKNTDAHAWTEVYFPTLGWIRLEPTPAGQGTANPPSYMNLGAGHGQFGNLNPTSRPTTPTGINSAGPNGAAFNKILHQTGTNGLVGGSTGKKAATPWTAVLLAVIAAIVLACGLIAIVAPPAQRTRSDRIAETTRRRRPLSLTSALLIPAAVALVALAMYRLLSRASGLNLNTGWATVGIAFGIAAALVLVAPATARITLRRWRWMRATDDTARAHAAWREFHDDLADYGIPSRPSEPPRTLATRITTGLDEPAAAAIRRLALAEERASYAASPAASQHLHHDSTAARRALAATTRRSTRWRAVIFPASLLTTLTDTATRLPDLRLNRWRQRHAS